MKTDDAIKAAFLTLLPTAEAIEARLPAPESDHDQDDLPFQAEDAGGRGVNRLLPMVEKDPLYLCDDGTGYIYRLGKLFLLDSKNQDLVQDLRLDGLELTGKAPSKDVVNTVIDLLAARSRRQGIKIELFNRCGEKNGLFYYDMGNGQAAQIGPGAWHLVEAPVMFRQLRHQKVQVPPVTGGDVREFLKFCDMPEEQHLLFLVTLVSCFVPRIYHPAIQVSSAQGSGKSVFTELWKAIIDPSSVMLSSMPRKPDDLDLLLVRHYGLVLDNLSSLAPDTCDRLCSFITGGTIEKRTLHTDLETTIIKGNTIIMYSSVVSSLHSRPDLSERTIVFELRRIADEKRVDKEEIIERFNAALPGILGGIFDLLAKAMAIYPTLQLARLPRMAGYAKWGFAIAEAMGGRGNDFLRDYAGNATIQAGALMERNTFFRAIVQAMDDVAIGELKGTFKEVLLTLMEVEDPGEAKNGYREVRNDKTFPTARTFRACLDRIKIQLEEYGISYVIDNHRTSRARASVYFYKKGKPGDETPF